MAIKSHPGAFIKDITNKIKSLGVEDKRLKTCDAVLIHAGINNISETETPSNTMDQYKELITTIKEQNRGAKIIVSSVLPKKSDKHSARSIEELNSKLNNMCVASEQMLFMDNTPRFTNGSRTIVNLYEDETHLSTRGAAVLAKNIMDAVNTSLKTGYNSKPNQAGNFRQSSLQKTMGQHQRWRGPPRRQGPPRRLGPPRRPGPPRGQGPPSGLLPPWMRMGQYWGPPPQYY